MPQTVEAVYHDGIVEPKHKPVGIQRVKVLVVFLDAEEAKESHAVALRRVTKSKSSVDKWIGVIEGVELGNWKAERRAAFLEGRRLEEQYENNRDRSCRHARRQSQGIAGAAWYSRR